MSIVKDAVREMQSAGYEASDVETMEKILRMFFDQWDSGGAVWAMAPILDRCIKGLPLSPLTGADDEWMCGHAEDGLCQNIRCGSVFKNAEGCVYDIDNSEWDGVFPYMPPHADLDPCIEMEA